MAEHVSPGVYSKIIDLSEYVATVPSTIGFIPIICEQGPDNQLILTNGTDFYIDFGNPDITYVGKAYGEGPYVASSFLKESDSLYVIRCLPPEATFSNLYFNSVLGGDSTAAVTAISKTVMTTTNALLTPIESLSDDAVFCIYAVGRGEYYNDFKISLSLPANPLSQETAGQYDQYILDIYQKQSEVDPVTGAAQYQIITTLNVSFDPGRLDASGESMFIQDVVNQYCRYLNCYANQDKCVEAVNEYADFSVPFISGPVGLGNGSTGIFDQNGKPVSDTLKQILADAYAGELQKSKLDYQNQPNERIDEVLDIDNHYFSVVLDGGYPFDVKASIVDLVQTRMDCMAFIDNGDNTSPGAAINERTSDSGGTTSINTRYVALYESYSRVYDIYSGRDIWLTPIYHMANIIPYTDNVSEVWYAPAGFNRATIASIKELRYSPKIGDRDQFYLNQLNPIVKFNVGYTVYGQLTSQRRPTSLQDVNVVRLVLYIKRALEQFCKFFLFELNDQETWSNVQQQCDAFLKDIQNRRGLYSYSIDVGATDYEIKTKVCHVNITLQPTKVIEKIYLNFYIK